MFPLNFIFMVSFNLDGTVRYCSYFTLLRSSDGANEDKGHKKTASQLNGKLPAVKKKQNSSDDSSSEDEKKPTKVFNLFSNVLFNLFINYFGTYVMM